MPPGRFYTGISPTPYPVLRNRSSELRSRIVVVFLVQCAYVPLRSFFLFQCYYPFFFFLSLVCTLVAYADRCASVRSLSSSEPTIHRDNTPTLLLCFLRFLFFSAITIRRGCCAPLQRRCISLKSYFSTGVVDI